jgi:hypothetical protein
VIVVACVDRAARATIGVRNAGGGRVEIATAGQAGPTSVTVTAGDVLRIGPIDDVVPGLTTWEVPAPPGRGAVIAVPEDPTDCEAWKLGEAIGRETRGGCVIGDGVFAIEARPIAPDAGGVMARNATAIGVIALPALLLLVGLCFVAPSRRRSLEVARALRIATVAVGLSALVAWRLTWAHRIDVLRELVAIGPRVDANLIAAALIGATIAGVVVAELRRRFEVVVIAWASWLAIAAFATGAMPAPTAGCIGGAALSLAGAVAFSGVIDRAAVARWLDRAAPLHALVGLAVLATATRLVAPNVVLVKLGAAWLVVVAGYAALRAALSPTAGARDRIVNVAAIAAATGSVAMLDAGVALVIVGTGLAVAMLVAGHDAMFDDAQAGRIGILERDHARLVAVHGAAAIAIAVGAATWAVVAGDQQLIERSTGAVLHAPLIAAVLFGVAAVLARSARRAWAPWLAAALAALALWGARDMVLARATAGDGVGAHRLSAVVDPGYAVLRDDRRFVATVSAWREAALPDGAVDPWHGEGYFGAKVDDPGVVISIENDYLPVLIGRELGVAGLIQTALLLLTLIVAAGATAGARLRHASAAHRTRALVAIVAGVIVVYQPLAALGVLPLTGITWPGLGIDSPADLWLFVLGALWAMLGAEAERASRDDERVRAAPRLRRARRIAIAALAIVGIAGVALVARAGSSALTRAVTTAHRGTSSGDARVDRALAYAESLACPWPERDAGRPDDAVPVAIAGTPTDLGTARFDRELGERWAAHRDALIRAIADGTCTGRAGAWRLAPDAGGTCIATFDAGWPQIQLAIETRSGDAATLDTDDAKASNAPAAIADPKDPKASDAKRGGSGTPAGTKATTDPKKPAAKTAKTAVADPRKAETAATDPNAATDPKRGNAAADPDRDSDDGAAVTWHVTCAVELPGSAIPMLRARVAPPTPPRIRLVSAAIGAAASDVGELVGGGTVLRLRAGGIDADAATSSRGMHVVGRVTLGAAQIAVRPDKKSVVLDGPAMLLVASPGAGGGPPVWRRVAHAGGERVLDRMTLIEGDRGRLWLYRPPRAWGNDAAVVDPVLADDAERAGDRARRAYIYGGALPELGWVNPFDVQRSLGLDGWVHASMARVASSAFAPPSCGSLAPPPIARARVCSPSPYDGVIECRVTLQPELVLALRSIADELVDRLPTPDAKDPARATATPTRASFVVMRGDTGELLAQGDAMPGRAPTAYAPIDRVAEDALIRLREDRDPVTGGPGVRGETDAERVDWNQPIAVGSTLKPIFARAAERAFPDRIDDLVLTATTGDGGCPRSRGGRAVDGMLGHCPPTSLAGEPTVADLHDFLAKSPNWYQAALGVLGLGLPSNTLAAGGSPVAFADVVVTDLATWQRALPIAIADGTGSIVTEKGISIDGVRRAPLWREVEAILGRPLCTAGDRASCRRAANRRDVCAARALPIASPNRDLRHLVALGPDRFDFYPGDRAGQRTIAMREYFQLLRGSGIHPIGSLAQITDAFGRVVYDSSTGSMKLAASWFPAPAVAPTPSWTCALGAGRAATVRGADGGLCGVMLPGGTAARAMRPLLADKRVVFYGAKTGTIDSLADVARKPSACAAWNRRHTIAGRPADRAHQPGWLDCGVTPPDDSLFLVAFGVVTPTGTIPITLGIHLQRGGKGSAALATRRYVDAIARYLAP